LTILERGEHFLRRKEIYEARHPEAKRGQYGGGRDGVGTKRRTESETISFSADTAAKLDVSPRTVQQEPDEIISPGFTIDTAAKRWGNVARPWGFEGGHRRAQQ